MPTEKKTAEQILKTTRSLFNSASFRANQYKQVVQKKIDLGAIQKKIELLHYDLGKAVDDQYQAGQQDLLASKEVGRIMEKLVGLKQAAVLLEEEIEQIRSEPPETGQDSDSGTPT
jgi:hypothetical protein